jgi:uncharacterized protein YjbI with pentapeptide repeats
MNVTRDISLKELCSELVDNPDLRRLGPYRVVADPEQSIFPIDINFEGKDVHFGDGDFTDGFVGMSKTKAGTINFGSSRFFDLYLDDLEAELVSFESARASRLYFDQAKLAECRFDDFVAPEVYFDDASIVHVTGDRLRTGTVFLERLQSPGFRPSDMSDNAYRVIRDGESTDIPGISEELTTPEARIISTREFQQLIHEDADFRRLGPYRVVPELDNEDARILRINLELPDGIVNFGQGDFTELKVQLAETKAGLVDFAGSKFDTIDFADAEIGDCFLAGSELTEINFGKAKIVNVFGEQCSAAVIRFEALECQQFNINEMHARQLRLREARIRELYLSCGDGIEEIYFDNAELQLLNLHEGSVREVHFGESAVQRALINKAHIRELNIENLRADKLYIGNDGHNEIGRLRFDQIEGIGTISIERAFYDETRQLFGDIEGFASRVRPPELQESPIETLNDIHDIYDPELDTRPRLDEQEEGHIRREGESFRSGEGGMNN